MILNKQNKTIYSTLIHTLNVYTHAYAQCICTEVYAMCTLNICADIYAMCMLNVYTDMYTTYTVNVQVHMEINMTTKFSLI